MAYNKGNSSDSPMRRRGPRRRKKVCAFCSDKEHDYIDYKDKKNYRNMCQTPARSHCSNQTCPSRSIDAIHTGLINHIKQGRTPITVS